MQQRETAAEIAARHGATVANRCVYRVLRPQKRWKYGTHSVYNPRKSHAPGMVPRMYRGLL